LEQDEGDEDCRWDSCGGKTAPTDVIAADGRKRYQDAGDRRAEEHQAEPDEQEPGSGFVHGSNRDNSPPGEATKADRESNSQLDQRGRPLSADSPALVSCPLARARERGLGFGAALKP